MKKIYTIILGSVLFCSIGAKAQDTLLFQDFQDLGFDTMGIVDLGTDPSALGQTTSTDWYRYDGDGLANGSAQPRGDNWYPMYAFADSDTLTADGSEYNIVMVGNSWFSPAGVANNVLITPSIMLGSTDTLFFKTATFQTPRYCDGMAIKISTTTNSDLAFTTLMNTAEMTSILGTNDSVFAGYTFSSGYVHGMDGTYVEYHADSARLRGQLIPWSIALAPLGYSNEKVFFAFVHNSDDDNIISLDDVMVRGDLFSGIDESETSMGLNVYPNPAEESAQLKFELFTSTNIVISVFDVSGKLITSLDKGVLAQGRHFATLNTAAMAKGFYTVKVQSEQGSSVTKLIVK